MAWFQPGDIIRFPKNMLAAYKSPSDMPNQMMYDEAYYDYERAMYRTRSQDLEISQLKSELSEKKKDSREKLKSIVGYFYKRR